MNYRILLVLVGSLAISHYSTSQDEKDQKDQKRDKLAELSEEIANLTRTPMGEGDLVLKNWIQYSIEERGRKRYGRIHFSSEDSAVVWFDDIDRPKSYFYRATPTSPIITVIPSINQGTQLTEEMMTTMGYSSEVLEPVVYELKDSADSKDIVARPCKGAVSENCTMWICPKSELKKDERRALKRGIVIWLSTLAGHSDLKAAVIEDSWNVLGFSEKGYEFEVFDWGFEDNFAVALDKIMVNIPGRTLNQVAKEYYEKHLEEEGKEEGN